MVSHKCQYALRAVFELAKHYGQPAVRIGDIAEAQAIPHRFLEVILAQLKQGGFVTSQRGSQGGYSLTRDPRELTVGEIIRFVEGPLGPVDCVAHRHTADDCPLYADCVFLPMWERVRDAVAEVYDTTTFGDLVERERQKGKQQVLSYAI